MNSLSKIAFAAVVACTAQAADLADAKDARLLSRNSPDEGRQLQKKKSPFDDDEPYFLAKCMVKDGDGNKKGKVIFHQALTDDGEFEPTSISARVRGAAADRVAIEMYNDDPQTDGAVVADNYGEFRPNARNVVTVFGLYNDDITLNGDATLDGAFIAFRCVESGNLVGSC